MRKTDLSKFGGAMSAIFTPYDRKGRVNLEMLGRIVDFHLENGLTGFYVTGSTGEGFLLSEEERRLVMSHVVKCNRGRGKVIAHVGQISTDRAVDLAKAAADCGVDMVSSVGPVYYGQSFEGAMRHYKAIAMATDLPFVIYSLGMKLEPERDIRFFDIPNVVGMKYTGADFYSVQQIRRKIQKDNIFYSGFDEQLVAGCCFGFDGGIGTTYNFAPRHFSRIFELCSKNKVREAMVVQEEINKVIYLMNMSENRSYQKAVMRYIGYDSGYFRAPFAPLTEKEYQDYAAKLDKLGILKRNDGQ